MSLKTTARAWGTRFDSLPSSPPPSPDHARALIFPVPSDKKSSDDKAPHDASIFVGSLPTHIEHNQLSQLLTDHLSQHGEIVSIKVVRDSKGGACAFVQCQDADAAAQLLRILQATEPKQFYGRILRYEAARAFRTLLISYRIPTQFISAPNMVGNHTEDYPAKGQTVDLELPFAMRMWRPKHSKYPAIIYNADAVDAKRHDNNNKDQTTSAEHAMHVQPVRFDVESIRHLAAYFGPVQTIEPYKGLAGDDGSLQPLDVTNPYPFPHNTRRTPNQDTGCYEVKWVHRDDCVSALMTLRRVPHLTVTWAHQPGNNGFERPLPFQHTRFPAQNVAPYPFHVVPGRAFAEQHRSSGASKVSPHVEPSGFGSWYGSQQPLMAATASISQNSDLTLVDARRAADWSETDFPPLFDRKNEHGNDRCGVWVEKKSERGDEEVSEQNVFEDQAGHALEVVPRHNDSAVDMDVSLESQYADDYHIPPTPGLAMSPITPKTPSSQFPHTPTSMAGDFAAVQSSEFPTDEQSMYIPEGIHTEKELDPTTLFVGGLEMHGLGAWDEEKVKNFFAQYDGLESIKLVRPANGKAAFAFVKFNNTESPAHAVAEVHNKIVEGRAMRVQLRDCNPPRGTWKQRGRGGRYPYHSFGSQHDIYHQQHIATVTAEHPIDVDTTATSTLSVLRVGDPAQRENTTITTTSEVLKMSRPPSPKASEPCEPSSTHVSSIELAPAQGEETFRDWYEPEARSDADTHSIPPPSPYGSPPAYPVPTAPYAVAPGFYGPAAPPWMYSQQIPYPMPYYGSYPGYGVPGQHPSVPANYTGSTGSDGGVPSAPPPVPHPMWPGMGMYGAFIPYPTFPARHPQNADQPSPQAPVVPTGFIQNEHGTLIAVYQPEALDQYMTGQGSTSAAQTAQNSVNASPVPVWAHYPHHHAMQGLPPIPVNLPNLGVPRLGLPPTPTAGNWYTNGQTSLGLTPPPHMPFGVMPASVSMGQLGSHGQSNNHLQGQSQFNKRGIGRRDSFSVRGNHHHRGNGRRGRGGGGHHPNFTALNPDAGYLRPVHMATAVSAPPGDWAQWSVPTR